MVDVVAGTLSLYDSLYSTKDLESYERDLKSFRRYLKTVRRYLWDEAEVGVLQRGLSVYNSSSTELGQSCRQDTSPGLGQQWWRRCLML